MIDVLLIMRLSGEKEKSERMFERIFGQQLQLRLLLQNARRSELRSYAMPNMMVDLDTTAPKFWWTFDGCDDLEDRRESYDFGDSVWREDQIPSYTLSETSIRFDYPENWYSNGTISFELGDQGKWYSSGDRHSYEAMRGETVGAVILTGRWEEPAAGRGVFIAIFPKRTPATHI